MFVGWNRLARSSVLFVRLRKFTKGKFQILRPRDVRRERWGFSSLVCYVTTVGWGSDGRAESQMRREKEVDKKEPHVTWLFVLLADGVDTVTLKYRMEKNIYISPFSSFLFATHHLPFYHIWDFPAFHSPGGARRTSCSLLVGFPPTSFVSLSKLHSFALPQGSATHFMPRIQARTYAMIFVGKFLHWWNNTIPGLYVKMSQTWNWGVNDDLNWLW